MTTPVLIVGAGPTGLALAIGLEKHNVPFRIIEQNTSPGTTSRAIAVHARTFEFIGSSAWLSGCETQASWKMSSTSIKTKKKWVASR